MRAQDFAGRRIGRALMDLSEEAEVAKARSATEEVRTSREMLLQNRKHAPERSLDLFSRLVARADEEEPRCHPSLDRLRCAGKLLAVHSRHHSARQSLGRRALIRLVGPAIVE